MNNPCCEQCRERPVAVNYGTAGGEQRKLCSRCYNTLVAQECGLDFEHTDFEPIELTDARGNQHTFHFETFHYVSGVSLKAVEMRDGETRGYVFEVAGESEAEEPLELFGRLFQKMQRGLALQHIDERDLGPGINDAGTVRARIEWDEDQDGQVPLVVIDGREFTWEQLGRMMMSYEGWQLKLQIHDMTEDI